MIKDMFQSDSKHDKSDINNFKITPKHDKLDSNNFQSLPACFGVLLKLLKSLVMLRITLQYISNHSKSIQCLILYHFSYY